MPDGAAWAPWVEQGSEQRRLSPPPPGWAPHCTRGRIVPTEVPGLVNTSGHCVSAPKAVSEALVTAGQQCRTGRGLPHPLLDPGLGPASGRHGRQRPQTATCYL